MRVRSLNDATRNFPYLRDAVDASRALVPLCPTLAPPLSTAVIQGILLYDSRLRHTESGPTPSKSSGAVPR